MAIDDLALTAKIRTLPPDLQREVEDFIEFLIEKRRRAELSQLAVANGWPPEFVQTAGAVDAPTFIRHPQGEYERRDPLE